MKVTLLVGRAGLNFTQEAGETIEVSDREGEAMIAAAQAIPAKTSGPKATKKVQKATKEPAETRTQKIEKAQPDEVETQDAGGE